MSFPNVDSRPWRQSVALSLKPYGMEFPRGHRRPTTMIKSKVHGQIFLCKKICFFGGKSRADMRPICSDARNGLIASIGPIGSRLGMRQDTSTFPSSVHMHLCLPEFNAPTSACTNVCTRTSPSDGIFLQMVLEAYTPRSPSLPPPCNIVAPAARAGNQATAERELRGVSDPQRWLGCRAQLSDPGPRAFSHRRPAAMIKSKVRGQIFPSVC